MSFDENDDGGGLPQLNNDSHRRFLDESAGALGGPTLGGAFATAAVADEHDQKPELPESRFADNQTEMWLPGGI